jgi:hypothetical protein
MREGDVVSLAQMKRQSSFLLVSALLGFTVASIAGGWIVLLKPPVVKHQIAYWWLALYGVDVSALIRCLIYLCYERFMGQMRDGHD